MNKVFNPKPSYTPAWRLSHFYDFTRPALKSKRKFEKRLQIYDTAPIALYSPGNVLYMAVYGITNKGT